MPTRNVTVPVNKEVLLAKGIVPEKSADRILDTMVINMPNNEIRKSDMMILDLLRNNNWERPIHFIGMSPDLRIDLKKYMQSEGFSYKLVPLKPLETTSQLGVMIDADDLYDKLMNSFRWTNMNKKGIFIDYTISFNLTQVVRIRDMHARAAEALLLEGKNEKAIEVLDSVMVRMPTFNFPCNISAVHNDYAFLSIIHLYYRLGEQEKADALTQEFYDATEKNVIFFAKRRDAQRDFELNLFYLQHLSAILRPYNEEMSDKVYEIFYAYALRSGLFDDSN
jgi:hypothetical protein